MDATETETPFDNAVLGAVAPGTTLLCVVPEGDDPALQRTLEAAAALAARQGATVMLYDRTTETWADTDHSHEITDPAHDEELDDAPHVRAAMDTVTAAGVKVEVWRSTIPAFATGILNAIQQGGADVVVLPEAGGTTNTFEKLFGTADLAHAVITAFDAPVTKDADAVRPVIVVGEDGTQSLVTT